MCHFFKLIIFELLDDLDVAFQNNSISYKSQQQTARSPEPYFSCQPGLISAFISSSSAVNKYSVSAINKPCNSLPVEAAAPAAERATMRRTEKTRELHQWWVSLIHDQTNAVTHDKEINKSPSAAHPQSKQRAQSKQQLNKDIIQKRGGKYVEAPCSFYLSLTSGPHLSSDFSCDWHYSGVWAVRLPSASQDS